MKNSPLIGSLQVILASICWGTLGIFSTQLGNLGFESFEIATLRIVTAGAVMLLLVLRLLATLKSLNTKQWLVLAVQSFIGVLGMTLCYFYAVQQVGVSLAVALLYTAPVFSLVLAKVMLGETISSKSAILAVLAVLGVACLMVGGKMTLNAGVIVGLLSGLCYSLYGILGKKAMSNPNATLLPAMVIFFSSVTFSAVLLLLLPQTYTTYAKIWLVPSIALLWVGGLSVVGTIVPFFLYMTALQKLPATKASVFTIIEPLTAIILATVLLKQPLHALQMLGIGLIIFATLANAVF